MRAWEGRHGSGTSKEGRGAGRLWGKAWERAQLWLLSERGGGTCWRWGMTDGPQCQPVRERRERGRSWLGHRVGWARPREREGEENFLFIFQTNFQNPFKIGFEFKSLFCLSSHITKIKCSCMYASKYVTNLILNFNFPKIIIFSKKGFI